MIQINRKIIVNKPVKDVWKVLFGRFTEVGTWVTGVYKSRPATKEENCDRVCDTFTGKLYEKIIYKDEKNHTFKVGVKGLPSFVKKFEGGWTLKKITNSSTEAAFELKIETKGIIGAIMQFPMKSKLTKGLNTLRDDLVTWVETGKVSSKKHQELNKKK